MLAQATLLLAGTYADWVIVKDEDLAQAPPSLKLDTVVGAVPLVALTAFQASDMHAARPHLFLYWLQHLRTMHGLHKRTRLKCGSCADPDRWLPLSCRNDAILQLRHAMNHMSGPLGMAQRAPAGLSHHPLTCLTR